MTKIEILTHNIREAINRLRGEADELQRSPECRGDPCVYARIEAMRDAADVVEAAMKQKESLIFDAYL